MIAENTLAPLYLMSSCQKPGTNTKRISFLIILPSGVRSWSFRFRVIDEGDVLELVAEWASPLVDIHMVHQKLLHCGMWSRIFHSTILGLKSALFAVHNDLYYVLSSTAMTVLSFKVQTHIVSINNIAYTIKTLRIVYIDLRAIAKYDASLKHMKSFEIVSGH